MRAIAGLFFTILFVGVLIAIGDGIYTAGVAQGIVDAGRVPAGAAVGVAGYGWGFHGFGFFGLLVPLFFLFLLFGIIRAIFGFGGRGRGWSHDHDGYGYRGWGDGPKGGPGGWREERERRMADMHRRLHEEEAASGGSSTGGASSGSGSTGSNPS